MQIPWIERTGGGRYEPEGMEVTWLSQANKYAHRFICLSLENAMLYYRLSLSRATNHYDVLHLFHCGFEMLVKGYKASGYCWWPWLWMSISSRYQATMIDSKYDTWWYLILPTHNIQHGHLCLASVARHIFKNYSHSGMGQSLIPTPNPPDFEAGSHCVAQNWQETQDPSLYKIMQAVRTPGRGPSPTCQTAYRSGRKLQRCSVHELSPRLRWA